MCKEVEPECPEGDNIGSRATLPEPGSSGGVIQNSMSPPKRETHSNGEGKLAAIVKDPTAELKELSLSEMSEPKKPGDLVAKPVARRPVKKEPVPEYSESESVSDSSSYVSDSS
jgi:hypothetical protein